MTVVHRSPDFWSTWQVAPALTIPAILIGYLYFLIARERKVPQRTLIAFYSGIFSFLLVVVTPIGSLATTYFWCHMIQHMVLMMVTGPLLVLGSVNLFRPKNVLFLWFSHSWVSWFLYAALMVGVHFTALHSILMTHAWAHDFIAIPLYVIVAYLFYYSILDRDNPERRITPAMAIFSLFFMMVPETLTGFFIYVSPTSLYGSMFTLDDQRRGGSLMWSGSMIIDVIWLSIAVNDWMKSEVAKSKIIDAEIAQSMAAQNKEQSSDV